MSKNYDDTIDYEIPRVIFSYENISINIAKSRLDIVIDNDAHINDMIGMVSEILDPLGLKRM
jgi:hypothetical protein